MKRLLYITVIALASACSGQIDPEDEQPVENTALFQSRQRVMELLSTLTEQEKKLLVLRFGLEGSQPKTPQQVGEILGITAKQVINMETAVMRKLRRLEQ